MADHREHWPHLRNALSRLVEELSEKLDEKNRTTILDFIENNEFGVALEWLWSLVAEHSIRLTAKQRSEIQRLASDMKIALPEN